MIEHTSDPYWYLHVGRATDLSGTDALLYRALEMLPGVLSIGTLALFIVLAFTEPVIAAYLTIAFSVYWLFKTFYLSLHLRHNFKRMRHNLQLDWNARLKGIPHEHIAHLVIFPLYKESYEVIAESVEALLASLWDKKRVAFVVAIEERGRAKDRETAERIVSTYGDKFLSAMTS